MKWYLFARLPTPSPHQMILQKSMQVFFLLLLRRHTFLESNQTCIALQIWKADRVRTQSMRNKCWGLEYQCTSFSDWAFVKSFHQYYKQALIHLSHSILVYKLVQGRPYQSRFVLDWIVYQLSTCVRCVAMNWWLKQGYKILDLVDYEMIYPCVLRSGSM